MNTYLPPHAITFRDLYARAEHKLRRVGYMVQREKKALVDWRRFADELGDQFFERIRDSGSANTLVNEPPRVFLREGGWHPQQLVPLANVEELFSKGVSQVRHNIVHGEKYIESEEVRDDALVHEALWVLREAVATHPATKDLIG